MAQEWLEIMKMPAPPASVGLWGWGQGEAPLADLEDNSTREQSQEAFPYVLMRRRNVKTPA
jgi:hypothetical protein